MKRKWFLVSIAITLIAATSIFYWWRSRPTAVERFYEPTPDQALIKRDAQAAYATLEMTSVESFSDLDASHSYFGRVPIQDPQPATTQIPATLNDTQLVEAKRKLRSVLAQFVHYRLVTTDDPQRDVDRYIAWRHNRGDVTRPIDDPSLYMQDTYPHYVGSPLPDGISSDQAFRDIYLGARATEKPAGHITAISTNPTESLFAMCWKHTHIGSDQPVVNHPRGQEYWRGGQAGGSTTWFQYVHADPLAYTRVQVQLLAIAGIVVESQRGDRYPIVLWLVWNPERADWDINGMHFVNADLANLPALIY
ncbi:MAG: hypothetical protein KDA29_06905 [Phycisphaerales bacterium]|nr:hypothetical protein [Phycisphaerales bacterium]